MFKYFKTKSRAVNDAFEQGFKKGKKQSDRKWRRTLNKLKTEAGDLIKGKNEEIDWRDKRILKIENQLDKFVDIIANTRFFAIQIKETKTVEMLQLLAKQQELEKHTDNIESLFRQTKKAEKSARKEIDNYKTQKITEH